MNLRIIRYLSYTLSTLILLPIWAYLKYTELDKIFLPLILLIHLIALALYLVPKVRFQFWLSFGLVTQVLYYLSKLDYLASKDTLQPNVTILFLTWGLFLFIWLQLASSTKPVRGLLFSISFYLVIIFITFKDAITIPLTSTNSLVTFLTSFANDPWLNALLLISLFNLLLCYMFASVQLKEGMSLFLDMPVSYNALHDPLTQLPNRMLFLSQLSKALKSRQSKHKIAVLIIDLDQLKPINDTLGHLVGDEVLKQVAQRLSKSLFYKDRSVISRLGGDEYAVFIKGLQNKEEAKRQAQNMVDCLQTPFEIAGQSLVVTASIGLSLSSEHGDNNQSLLSKADKAMYRSKALGKNCYQVFSSEMDEGTAERLALKQSFKESFESEKLELNYQPIIEFLTEKVIRLEVLLRWYDEELGQVPPDEFIPIAEEAGLMIPLGEWVLRKASQSCKVWQQAGYSDIGIAINVSTLQLMQANFANTVTQVLQEEELKAEHLTIEITENSVIRPRAAEQLKKLSDLGVEISLDDFGIGYASFAQLKQLEVSSLKIDQSFIAKLGDTKTSSYSDNFIRTVIQFCKLQGITVTAEGVETQTHLNLLRQSSCDEGQGNLISQPLPLEAINKFLENPKQNYDPRLPIEFTSITLNKLSHLLGSSK